MVMLHHFLLSIVLHSVYVSAAPTALVIPFVTLGSATFVGETSGTVQRFLGILFAQPPVGNLRYHLPQPITYMNGSYDAKKYGPSCGQQSVGLPLLSGLTAEAVNYVINSIFGQVFPTMKIVSLTVNVVKPATATPGSKLPVVVWIFGGGFELGSTSMYDGALIVKKSQDLGQPIIYVSMNYKLTGIDFLASKEAKKAGVGNLGLQDQREALRWIQKCITQFGGDPTKVSIWGESAGPISVALQMVANDGNTEGLFRGGFMQSGATIPVGDITNGQKYYDAMVKETGCTGASDTLDCLRTIPYTKLKAVIHKSPGIFAYQVCVSVKIDSAVGGIELPAKTRSFSISVQLR
ncbi:putative secreted lipase [Psilocybe cubensis]|uniref:Secreted lipase n=1 Tax=Psilocybe cubensis TaxID=181762 RepID=A0ACB8GJ35_PSICU|nr:putative secreted lipase [Psilocybe cubensis]KAH9475407.1 putative secreted lipase [Psilocybe cubensis]